MIKDKVTVLLAHEIVQSLVILFVLEIASQWPLYVSDIALLTMQSCMILFQSSPVTMRKRTAIALPAVEKLACLQ